MNYDTLANMEAVQKAVNALAERGIMAVVVNNRAEALEKVKSLIPKGDSVMNGSSRGQADERSWHGWERYLQASYL